MQKEKGKVREWIEDHGAVIIIGGSVGSMVVANLIYKKYLNKLLVSNNAFCEAAIESYKATLAKIENKVDNAVIDAAMEVLK